MLNLGRFLRKKGTPMESSISPASRGSAVSLLRRLRSSVARLSGNRSTRATAAFCLMLIVSVSVFGLFVKMSARPGGLLVARSDHLVWKEPESVGAKAQASAPAAQVSFVLDNVGGRPVRIHSVESGCGCARPVVRPEVVAPGQAAVVDVTAMAIPVGQKVALIKLRTDSPIKPEVPLTLTIVGTRKPPFLFLLEGEAVFRGDYVTGMGREIAVLTVESHDKGAGPALTTDLPFLRLAPKGVEVKTLHRAGHFSSEVEVRRRIDRTSPVRVIQRHNHGHQRVGSRRMPAFQRSWRASVGS
jgi:hypothetical protein